MSNSIRTYLLIMMVLLLAVAAFAAGYLTNDLVEESTNGAAIAADDQPFFLLSEAWSWVERSFIGDIPPMQTVAYGAIRGALGTLGDPYTVLIEPPAREQERDSLRGNFGGIGANVMRNEAGEVVLEPIPGNPAETAGMQMGDILLDVDGVPITADMTIADIVQLIRGEKGTEVRLRVVHPGAAQPVELVIVRDDILIPSVSYRLLPEQPALGYIQLTRFSGESGNEVQEAIVALQEQGAQKLILDLRGNGGGLLNAAVDVADHFLEGGPVLYQQNRGQEEQLFEATAETVAAAVPLVLLIDGGTASASEILAGALQDRERATLVGSQSFGKGSVQLVYDLSDGSSVHITASRWYTPGRHQIDQQGLTPDIVVETTQEAIDTGRDPVLEQAIDYLENGNN